MYINQFFLMFIMYNRIFKSKYEQVMSNINEIIILLTVYHLFCFTYFVPDALTREVVGTSLISLTVLNFLINLLPTILFLIRDTNRRVTTKANIILAKKRKKDKMQRRINRSKQRKKFKLERARLREFIMKGKITSEAYAARLEYQIEELAKLDS